MRTKLQALADRLSSRPDSDLRAMRLLLFELLDTEIARGELLADVRYLKGSLDQELQDRSVRRRAATPSDLRIDDVAAAGVTPPMQLDPWERYRDRHKP